MPHFKKYNLTKYYNYWDDFVDLWFKKSHISNLTPYPWTNPSDKKCPISNNNTTINDSINYLPEPWWGYDGSVDVELHSVVINFNPGQGGKAQLKNIIKGEYHGSYARDIVNNSALPATRSWHLNRRALPILDSLNRLKYIHTPYGAHNIYGLQNHLSIELIPWHTAKASSNKEYWNYLEKNIEAVYHHSICFAADMSRIIANNKLRNVVILRMNGTCTNRIINYLDRYLGIKKYNIQPVTNVKNKGINNDGNYFIFKLDSMPDIKFVSIWPKANNDFPPAATLDKIIKSL